MNTSGVGYRAPAAVAQAIARRQVLRVPTTHCVSGLLGNDPLYHRLLLATDNSFTRLEANPAAKELIRKEVAGNSLVTLEREGLPVQLADYYGLKNWLTFVAYGQGVAEIDLCNEAIAVLTSTAPGIHRSLLVAAEGVRLVGADDLAPWLYRKLLPVVQWACRKGDISTIAVGGLVSVGSRDMTPPLVVTIDQLSDGCKRPFGQHFTDEDIMNFIPLLPRS